MIFSLLVFLDMGAKINIKCLLLMPKKLAISAHVNEFNNVLSWREMFLILVGHVSSVDAFPEMNLQLF